MIRTYLIFYLGIWSAAIALTHPKAQSYEFATNPRYATLQFVGTGIIPAGSRPEPLTIENAEDANSYPEADQRFDLRFLLTVDKENSEIWIFISEPLWRIDTGQLDQRKEIVWHADDSGVTLTYDNRTVEQPGIQRMWSFWIDAVFLNPFGIDTDHGLIPDIVEQIHATCRKSTLAMTPFEEVDGKYASARLAGVVGGKGSLENRWYEGKIVAATLAVPNNDSSTEFLVSSLRFENGMLADARAGCVSVALTRELPLQFRNWTPHKTVESPQGTNTVPSAKDRSYGLLAIGFSAAAFVGVAIYKCVSSGDFENESME